MQKINNKIIVLVGKSASGKDSVAKILVQKLPGLNAVISTTSRPMREKETEGVDYFFIEKEEFIAKIKEGSFWEHSSYDTYKKGERDHWYYGLDRNKVDLYNSDYIIPADLPRLEQLKKKFGSRVIAVYIDVPDNDRRMRAVARDENFDIIEWERRVSDENYVFQNITTNIDYVVSNKVLEECVKQVENIYKWHA